MNIKWWQNVKIWQNMKHFERNMSLWQTCVGLGCMQQWPAHSQPFPCPLSRSFFYIFFSNSLFILNIFVNHIARLYHKTIDRSINFTIVSLYCISGWHVNSVTFDTGALFRVHEQRLASLFASLWSDMEFVFVLVFLFVFVFVFVHEQRFFCLY